MDAWLTGSLLGLDLLESPFVDTRSAREDLYLNATSDVTQR